jgi:hypothetical protein
MSEFTGIFKARYPALKGRNWIKSLEVDDLQAFIRMGLAATDYGKKGGQVRAKGKRDSKGRFTK